MHLIICPVLFSPYANGAGNKNPDDWDKNPDVPKVCPSPEKERTPKERRDTEEECRSREVK
jgi:hypothetical protein